MSEGIAYGYDPAAMEGGDVYSMRIRLILSAAELFQLLPSSGTHIPIKHTVIALDTHQGLQIPPSESLSFQYISHNCAVRNLDSRDIDLATRIPYQLDNKTKAIEASVSHLLGNTGKYIVREGSLEAAKQLGVTLQEFSGNDHGEQVSGLKLFEFEVGLPRGGLGGLDLDAELVRVTLTLNVRAVNSGVVKPMVRFMMARGVPDLAYAPDQGNATYASVDIIQLPDEGYPYIGIDTEEKTNFGVLNWHNAAGKQGAVRIRNLEDPSIRLVIPALRAAFESMLPVSDYRWVIRRGSCELGFNEDHGWWNVMNLNNPAVFKEMSDRTEWWDSKPSKATALTPVMYYNRVRPSVLVREMPSYPLKEIIDVIPLKHYKI